MPTSADLARKLKELHLLYALRPGGSREAMDLDDPAADPQRLRALKLMRQLIAERVKKEQITTEAQRSHRVTTEESTASSVVLCADLCASVVTLRTSSSLNVSGDRARRRISRIDLHVRVAAGEQLELHGRLADEHLHPGHHLAAAGLRFLDQQRLLRVVDRVEHDHPRLQEAGVQRALVQVRVHARPACS